MTETVIGVFGLLLLIGLFLTGLEMAFAMAIVGVVGYAVVMGPTAAMSMLANDFVDSLQAYGITVFPLFMLMGQIVFNGGMARRLYDGAYKFLGHVPGGLAVATVAGAGIFKAMCGSATATSATFASVAVPEMDRYGYSKKLSTGIVATVGTLGMLIPPAGTLILLGIITEQSIGKLFVAGIVPGIILALLFVGVILGWARVDPAVGPRGPKSPWPERLRCVPEFLWPAIVFVVMIGGLMKGIFTPTEAGAVGLFSVLVITVAKKDVDFAGIRKSTVEALRTTNMIVLLIATSTMLGHFITVTDIPNQVAEVVAGLPFERSVTLCIIFAVYLIGGTFMDDLAFLILATPIFWPAMIKLGYDPIWLCITMSVVLGIGSIIPPMAICVFIVRQITGVPIGVVYRGVYPFLISLLLCLALLFAFPELVLYLPSVTMP
ncbi:MAG: C4-dicarboxylate TRAP transporter large permease protein DctM [Burkholderiaceae bacterium]|nr:C4-dicarboxylate TRAP transporter large permease protein DctM [Burkholderiaceae bacterium]